MSPKYCNRREGQGDSQTNPHHSADHESPPAIEQDRPPRTAIHQEPEDEGREKDQWRRNQDAGVVSRRWSVVCGHVKSFGASAWVDDHNNLSPRLAIAFAPGSQRTVLRAGAGVF